MPTMVLNTLLAIISIIIYLKWYFDLSNKDLLISNWFIIAPPWSSNMSPVFQFVSPHTIFVIHATMFMEHLLCT